MTQREQDHGRGANNSVTVTGGTHVGGTIGAGRVDNHARVRIGSVGPGEDGAPRTVADLRSMLVAARSDIVDAATTDEQRADLAYELRKILEELDAPAPAPAPVRERWKTVQSVLGALAGSGAIAAITDLVTSLFGAE